MSGIKGKSGIYKRTKEHRKNLSNAKLGVRWKGMEEHLAKLRKDRVPIGVTKLCVGCGEKFYAFPYEAKIKKYCSRKCRDFRVKKVCLNCGSKFLVHKCNLDTAKFCSLKCIIRRDMSGENSPTWKGGITPEVVRIRNSKETKDWRLAVFRRDYFTDKKTGKKSKELEAHHILNFSDYPEMRFDVANGITLSKESHRLFHKLYGYQNNTREQLSEFYLNNDDKQRSKKRRFLHSSKNL